MPMKRQKKRARSKRGHAGLAVLHGGAAKRGRSKKRSVAYKNGKRVRYPKIGR